MMMKRRLFTLLILLAALSASASTIKWYSTNWLALGVSPKSVTITQVGDTPFSAGNFIIVGLPHRFLGSAGTNVMAQGFYRMDLEGLSFARALYFVVPDDTAAYNVAQLRGTNAPTIPTITPAPVVPASVPSTISFFLTNFCQSVAPPTAITLTQLGDAPLSDGNLIIVGLPRRVTATSAGVFSASLFPSYYRLDIDSLTYAKPYLFVVPSGGTSYNAAQLRVTNTAPSLVPNLYALVSALLTNLSGAGLWLPDGSGMSNAVFPITLRGGQDTLRLITPFRIEADSLSFNSTNELIFRVHLMHWSDDALFDGNVTAASFSGSGSNLTDLPIPAVDPNTLTNNFAGTITATAFAGAGSGLTGLDASHVTTGTLPDARLANTGTSGTYRSVTTDTKGRVTSGSNPTTFSGYGLSDTSANLAAVLSDETGDGPAVFANSPTLTTPTIGSFANATHTHQSAATGGSLDAACIASGTLADARLVDTGTAGTYPKVTTDAKGRVTSGTTLSAGDIPAIAESGVTGLVNDLAGKQAGPLTGDVTTSGAAATLANAGTAGTYTKVTTDAKGRVTSGTTLAAGDIPAIAESGVTSLVGDLSGKQAGPLTGDVTTSGAAATLKNTGSAGTYTKTTFDAQGRETSGTSATLASADFVNQGTTTTVLHGNASGNPSFAAVDVSSAEITGTLKTAAVPAFTGDITTPGGSLVTTLAAGNAGNLNSGTLALARLHGAVSTNEAVLQVGYTGNLIQQYPFITSPAMGYTFITNSGDNTVNVVRGVWMHNSFSYNEFSSPSTFGQLQSITFSNLVGLDVGAFNPSTIPLLTNLSAPLLTFVGGNFSPSGLTICTNFSTPALAYVGGSFNPSLAGTITAVSLTNLAYIGGIFQPTMSTLLSFNLPALKYIGGTINPSLAALTSWSTPAVTFINGNVQLGTLAAVNSLTNLDFTSLVFVNGTFSPTAMSSLTNITGPALVWVSSTFGPTVMSSVTNFSFPNLAYVGSTLGVNTLGALKSLSLPALTNCVAVQVSSMTAMTFFNLPSMVSYGGSITLNNSNGAITNAVLGTVGTLKVISGTTINLSSQALTSASVNAILALLVSLNGSSGTTTWGAGKTLTINLGSNGAPTGQGITDKATLVGRGATVTTN